MARLTVAQRKEMESAAAFLKWDTIALLFVAVAPALADVCADCASAATEHEESCTDNCRESLALAEPPYASWTAQAPLLRPRPVPFEPSRRKAVTLEVPPEPPKPAFAS